MSGVAMSQTVTYNGLGRIYVTDDHLKGNLAANDTISKNAGTGGYLLFDLGINVRPNDLVRASAIIRARNEFGGFYGDGSSFLFRQFKIDGIIGSENKGVKYEIGDLDLKMTEYTLFNTDEVYNSYESSVFKARREIVSYENFNFGNAWRLQGGHVSSNFLFEKGIQKAAVDFFATKTKSSASFEFPDRFLIGGRISVLQSKYFKLGVNAINLVDAKETIAKATYQYRNFVLTSDYQLKLEKEKMEWSQYGEFGNSAFSYSNFTTNKSNALADYFFDLGVAGAYKPLTIKTSVSFRNVGPNYISPAAQTRRTMDYGSPTLFGLVNKATVVRTPTLFDRYSQEGLYNQSILPVLMGFNPRFNNVTPYGKATPNRQGLTMNVLVGNEKKVVSADFTVEMLKEIIGEGVKELRNFMSLRGGGVINAGKIIGYNKGFYVNLGMRYENTSRDISVVDLTSTLYDIGGDFEIIKNLSMLVGYKYLTSGGSELISIRNEYNTISGYTKFNQDEKNVNISEGIISFGGRFMLGQYSGFSIQAHLMNYKNNDSEAENYNIAQYFFGYTLKF